MGKYSLFFILLLLSACAHQRVQENPVKIPEVAETPKAPIVNMEYSENDSFVDYPPAEEEQKEEVKQKNQTPVCSSKDIMFLVKQPYVGVNSLLEAHKGLIRISQMLYRLLQFYPKIESKEISPADFNALAQETLELADKIYILSNQQAGLFSEIETYTRQLYYVCEEEFNQLLIKVEEGDKNSCMLYQQRAYIEDPFGLKSEIGVSSAVEMYIQKYFKSLVLLLVDYNSGKLPLEDFQKNYDSLLSEYQKGQFSAVSLYLKNNVELLSNTTFNIHEACDKSQ